MFKVAIPPAELGTTESFLSYDTLTKVNAVDPRRQFKYHPRDRYFTPSATFHNRALMQGIGENSARDICEELRSKGYAGLVEIVTINPRAGVNQIRGRPVIQA